mmetsp:Transcript_67510/g.197502  ORF Transcript_67510/g.197502 Transcript_67510/m.197502 type:complete len:293 (-) Transcript_67510:55-933(-)
MRCPGEQAFNELSGDVLKFLEAHPRVAGVKFSDRPGVAQGQLQAWDDQNQPYSLPEDYKAFLSVSNGATVRWSLRFAGEAQPFGVLHVNQLEQVKRLPAACLQKFDLSPPPKAGAEASSRPPRPAGQQQAAAFDLDAECGDGRMALVYCSALQEGDPKGAAEAPPPSRPQVWFQDPAGRWHYVAGSFADYFRLVVTHLGVPQWQFAFTDIGPASAARHWLAFFCPERLALASERRAAAEAARSERRGGGRHGAFEDATTGASSSAPSTARNRPPRRRERPTSAIRRSNSGVG